MINFIPPRAPDAAVTKTVEPRVAVATFGDGYSQRAADGINNMPRQVQLRWSGLSFEEAAELESFFDARGGHEAFTYQPPGFSEAAKWFAPGWRVEIFEQTKTVTLVLTEVFDVA